MSRVIEFLRAQLPQRERDGFVKPQQYALSSEEFEKSNVVMMPYKPFDPVERSNFTPWLAMSFAESRGNVDFQILFWRLTRLNTGLDVAKTLKHFAWHATGEYNPWKRLKPDEQQYVAHAYNRLTDMPRHKIPLAAIPVRRGEFVHPRYDVGAIFNTQIKAVYHVFRFFPFNLTRIYPGMTIGEFRKARRPYLRTYKV